MPANEKPALAAWALGLAGAVPFVATAVGYCAGPENLRGPMSLALLTYAAVILSFLGGVRWGMECIRHHPPRALTLGLSVLPSLAAWGLLIGAIWMPVSWQLGGLIAVLLAQWLWDTGSAETPPWYGPLRTTLTLIAGVSMAFVFEQSLRG
jgi:Protein of unknown function (DUF3429)